MAENNRDGMGAVGMTKKPTPPLEFFRCSWGDYYAGSMQQLIGTGNFKTEWFPGMPGNRPTANILKMVEFGGRTIPELRISRRDGSRKRFVVMARIDEREKEVRAYKDGYERARASSIAWASTSLRNMAKSKDEFLGNNLFVVQQMMGICVNGMEAADGYSLNAESAEKLSRAMRAVIDALSHCGVDFSPEVHEEKRRSLAVEAFERGGLGQYIDAHPAANIDREAEKAQFIADVLVIN